MSKVDSPGLVTKIAEKNIAMKGRNRQNTIQSRLEAKTSPTSESTALQSNNTIAHAPTLAVISKTRRKKLISRIPAQLPTHI